MILANKISKLRKMKGWSQDELANKMNVSRQTIAKWESAISIPDLNKILELAHILGATTDYLLKDELEELEMTNERIENGTLTMTLDKATDYINTKMTAAKMTTRGVLVVLTSVIPLFLLLAFADLEGAIISDNVAVAVGLVSILVLVSSAVNIFIRSSQYEEKCKKFEQSIFELDDKAKSVMTEKLESYRPTYTSKLSFGITLFITCSLPLIVSAIMGASGFVTLLMVVVLFIMIMTGLSIVIPISTKYTAYNLLLGEGEFATERKTESKREEKISAFYWPLVTAIYLGWSFWTMDWGTTWIVWPVAGVLFAAVLGLVALVGSDN